MRKYTGIILIFLVPLFFSDCHRTSSSPPTHPAPYAVFQHWISWNLSFTPVSAPDSISIITALENYVTTWATNLDPTSKLTFKLLHCPCDTLLTNLDATLLTGSGKPVTPPPTQPNPGPTGDYLLGNNFEMNIPSNLDSNNFTTVNLTADYLPIAHIPSTDSLDNTLAVIDTGLDTALFQKQYPKSVWAGNLLWEEKPETLFDVVPGETTNLLIDSCAVKHGTAATAIILSQMARMKPNRIPKIMSIRAFDDSEKGSIYTVSCALSYAIQKKVSFVNASWGYYGKKDSVLLKYIKRADSAHIRIIAAAGNTLGKHLQSQICSPVTNTVNNLNQFATWDSLFYPACFAPDIPNLVSVTQLHEGPAAVGQSNLVPCFYQNYSPNYITVGAHELKPVKGECCQFSIPFLKTNIEGSSFATPVITAELMFELANTNLAIKPFILSHSRIANTTPTGAGFFTNQGRYIEYELQH
jgi:hypothetical protein